MYKTKKKRKREFNLLHLTEPDTYDVMSILETMWNMWNQFHLLFHHSEAVVWWFGDVFPRPEVGPLIEIETFMHCQSIQSPKHDKMFQERVTWMLKNTFTSCSLNRRIRNQNTTNKPNPLYCLQEEWVIMGTKTTLGQLSVLRWSALKDLALIIIELIIISSKPLALYEWLPL